MKKKLAIGTDHRGFFTKQKLVANTSFSWIDYGTFDENRTDFPLFVTPVVNAVLTGAADGGVLLCGTGVGMSIAANRHKGIYAALVWSVTIARLAKEHDNANILVLPADYMSHEDIIASIVAWSEAEFSNGRYQERLKMIDQ